MFFSTILLLCALQVSLSHASSDLPIRNVFTFPDSTFVEDIAVRSNGDLIVLTPSIPAVFSIDPKVASPVASAVHTFPSEVGPWGITEITHDKFVVVTGSM